MKKISSKQSTNVLGIDTNSKLIIEYRTSKNDIDKERILDVLIKRNEGFIKSIANKYSFEFSEKEDAYQDGVIGFIKALDRFDISRGIKFTTFSFDYIRREVSRKTLIEKKSVSKNKKKEKIVKISIDDSENNGLSNSIELSKDTSEANDLKIDLDMSLDKYLKPLERDVLKLHFYEDLTLEEVAKKLDMTENYVNIVKKRALSKLKGKLNKLSI